MVPTGRHRNRACAWAALAAALILLAPLPAGAGDPVPLSATYAGDFSITFGTGPGGTDDLFFGGAGLATGLGVSRIDGHSTTRAGATDPLAAEIVTDWVTLTAANGDELWLVNAGTDHLSFPAPGAVSIRGAGTFTVAGGTGRFDGATGSGSFEVAAAGVFVPGGVEGTFALRFTGRVELADD